jgi:hypothetical protein
MGGLFRAPKPVVVASPQPAAAVAAATAPSLSPEAAAETARVEARARSQRGRPGTIATSARGVLAPLPGVARKTLLGE